MLKIASYEVLIRLCSCEKWSPGQTLERHKSLEFPNKNKIRIKKLDNQEVGSGGNKSPPKTYDFSFCSHLEYPKYFILS
jgi:hypothetical protein